MCVTEESSKPQTDALEALLFASGCPITIKELASILFCDVLTIQNLLTQLEKDLKERGSGLEIHRVAGGCQLVTRANLYDVVKRLAQVTERQLSLPTMETLSIIAFKQPVTKAEIEEIRGVRVERALTHLLDLNLIEEVGRKKVIGRPILYGTTAEFLRCFGINSLEDLPALPTSEDVSGELDPEQLALIQEEEEQK